MTFYGKGAESASLLPTSIFALPAPPKILAGRSLCLGRFPSRRHQHLQKGHSMTSVLPNDQTPSLKRQDIHQAVTDTIIAQLEKGTVPWQRPWRKHDNDTSDLLPKNAKSGKNYRGVNILLLWDKVRTKDFTSHEWATFKQWKENGEIVRKGEKGNIIVYYDTIEKEVDGEVKEIPFLKQSYVFNRNQLESFDPNYSAPPSDTKPLAERIEKIEQFVFNTGVEIETTNKRAVYYPEQDKIGMPDRSLFVDTKHCSATEGYYSTLMHELIHWTGHKSRMNRTFGNRFGDKRYAVEELVAELGAAFTCTEFDISRPEKEHQASYIASWLDVLKANKYAVLAAASEASKATEYLYKLQLK